MPMDRLLYALSFVLTLLGFAAVPAAIAQSCPPTPPSDALRQIAQCLAGADCRGRLVTDQPTLGPECEKSVEVWWRADDLSDAVIRDRKMCLSRRRANPDPGFVHGLLIPLVPLCGVEDPLLDVAEGPGRRLWSDAWAVARTRLPEDQIVLAINPPTNRTLAHLHIHIMRARETSWPETRVILVKDLDAVWSRAAEFAANCPEMTGRNYGVAVRKQGDGFAVLVEAGLPFNAISPEYKYGIAED